MNHSKLARRVGVICIIAASVLRFAATGTPGQHLPLFAPPEVAAFLIRAEMGRDPAASTVPATTATVPTRPAPTTGVSSLATTVPTTGPTVPTTAKPTVSPPRFDAGDAAYLKLNYSCSRRPDTAALLSQSLRWSLMGQAPTVLIIHSHGTESYTPTADTAYTPYGGSFRTDDERYNMVSIGAELARLLTQAGIGVVHDTTAHDKDDYLDAYDNSRRAVQSYMKKYPTIRLVIDLHRDAATYADGSQWATSATVDGKKCAQLMFVVGSDAGGYTHPNWQTNLSIAEKLHVLMEKENPGIMRPLDLRAQRFNQDLSIGALLVEVGAAGNTHPQAMGAVPALAQAIIALSRGTG